MPIASSSAMCSSRATGSRPVQPAITAWSIASVSGVGAPLSSMVNVRSNTYNGLHSGGELYHPLVRSTWAGNHQADRHLALAMSRQRDRAAIDHVGQRAIAQAALVRHRERLVVSQIGDAGRSVGGRRTNKRVIGRNPLVGTRDQRTPCAEHVDVFRRADRLAIEDTGRDAGIVNIAFTGEQIAVPGITFRRGEAAFGVDYRHIEKLRHFDAFDQRTLARERRKRAL